MNLNYAVKERLRLIDFLLDHYGYIGRDQLVSYFGVSSTQATRDFKLYKERAPKNLKLNESTKKYEKTEEFKSLF